MKQNGVGLASIAVLATMVLVMLSTTVCMYAGIGDTIRQLYPHQVLLSASYYDSEGAYLSVPTEDLAQMVEETAQEFDLEISYEDHQRYLCCTISRSGDPFGFTSSNQQLAQNSIAEVWFMTAQEYERLTGESVTLGEHELAYYALGGNGSGFPDTLTLGEQDWVCRETLTQYPISMQAYSIVDCFGIVVPDETALETIFALQQEAYGLNASEVSEKLVLDFADEDRMGEVNDDFFRALREKMIDYVYAIPGADGGWGASVDSKFETIEYLYGMYGTFLFLGLLLSVIFIFATALIIYYKQISEGYEDRERFWIMQKVGMSQKEVKRTIRSQILLVFFLPLLVAALHTGFAFPILTRLLHTLFAASQMLFLACTLGALAAFSVLYVIIYSLTARAYYQLVRRT
jgi:putative ABC transport system permease protein